MNNRQKAIEYAKAMQDSFLNQLKEFVQIPSISTDPEKKRPDAGCR